MRRLHTVLGVLLLALTVGVGLHAQSYTYALNNTTLSAAQSASATTATLTSTSAITGSSFGAVAVGQALFVDHELERITAVSGSVVTVNRDYRGATSHASGARVFLGAPNAFQNADPPLGSCTQASEPLPWINVQTGTVWICRGSTGWTGTNVAAITYNSVAPGLPWG